jgi:hypothetical protein
LLVGTKNRRLVEISSLAGDLCKSAAAHFDFADNHFKLACISFNSVDNRFKFNDAGFGSPDS